MRTRSGDDIVVDRREVADERPGAVVAAAASESDLVARCQVLTLDILQDGEIILLDLRPHGASALLSPVTLIWFAIAVPLLLLAPFAFTRGGSAASLENVVLILSLGTLALIFAQVLELRHRRYILTDRRVIAFSRFMHVAMPLSAVRTVKLTRSRRERLVDLGTLHFNDHGNRPAVRWDMLGRPEDVMRAVEDCVERYARGDFERDAG